MIALVTDSNSQITPGLVERFGVTVVPLSVTVNGVTYLEGVDLDADGFFALLEEEPAAVVTTAQPSPGRFAAAYRRSVDEGAESILSVHVGSAVSGTVNSAQLAARGLPVPVRIVDSGTASFALALSVWAAGEALSAGADLDEAAAAAEETARSTGTVFVLGALDLARAGGRLAAGTEDTATTPVLTMPVLTMADGVMRVVGQATDRDAAVEAMVAHVAGAGDGLRVGIGMGDRAMAPVCDALHRRLAALPGVREVVPYRIGPSVGAHTGPGTVGAMYGRTHD